VPGARCLALQPGRLEGSLAGGWTGKRLAAVTAAVAPGIPIIDAGIGPNPSVEEPGQAANAQELSPTD